MIAAYDLLALGAALCWATGSLIAVTPVRHLGAFAFTRWRMLLVASVLWVVVLAMGTWQGLAWHNVMVLAASGMTGIFIGDTALFGAMQRLGPRRAGVLFATHSVFSVSLGFVVLGERMSLQAAWGAACTVAGVGCAILWGRAKDDDHAWEADRGSLVAGVAMGLVAALGQALGTLIAKPVVSGPAAVDPLAASAVRVTVACVAHFMLLWAGVRLARAENPPTARVLGLTALNGLVGMGLGMSFILMALQKGDVGMVAVLSSVSPVLLLPLLWLRLKRPPALGAWVGAILTVLGTVAIVLR